MKKFKRKNTVIMTVLIVCMVIVVLLATAVFIRHAQQPADGSSEQSAESFDDITSEETILLPDAMEALYACIGQVQQAHSFSSVTQGFCDTQILFFNYRHSLSSRRFINGDELLCMDTGIGSMIRYGSCRYILDDVRLIRVGQVYSDHDVVWSDMPVSVSSAAYHDSFGDIPRGLSHYLLDNDTVTSAILKSYTDDAYTFVYKLDPSKATESYAKCIKSFYAFEQTPSFRSVEMTVIMDHDLYPVSVTYEETYSVTLPLLGETLCKAEYTETFSSFNESVTIPEQAFYSSFLTLSAQDACPAVSAGYQVLLSLFEDRTAYALSLSLDARSISMDLFTDTASGAICAQNDELALLYQNDCYYLTYDDIHVYSEAEKINNQLLHLFSAKPAPAGAPTDHSSGLFSDFDFRTEDGKVILSSVTGERSMYISIDAASMSLLSAYFEMDISGISIKAELKKTSNKSEIPDTSPHENISDSVSAIAFLTTILSGDNLQYSLEVGGAVQYSADVVLSSNQSIAFSALSTSDTLPLDLYLRDGALAAVFGDVSVSGLPADFISLLSLGTANEVMPISENRPTRLSSISHGKDMLTLHFLGQNVFSISLMPDCMILNFEQITIRLVYFHQSKMPPHSAPTVQNMLSATDLYTFLNGSVYPSVLSAGSIGAKIELTNANGTVFGDLLLTLAPQLAASFVTELNGVDTSIVYQDETVFVTNMLLSGFVKTEHIETVINRLALLGGGITVSPVEAKAVSAFRINCDGKTMYVSYGELEIQLQKQSFLLKLDGATIIASEINVYHESAKITPPKKEDCIDLEMLSERLVSLSGQTEFSFTGTVSYGELSAVISRLDVSLDMTQEISSAALSFSFDHNSLYHVVYDGEAIYFDAGEIKLFGIADQLIKPFLSSNEPQTVAAELSSGSPDLRTLRSVTFKNDILTIVLDSALIKLELKRDGLESLQITSKSFEASFRKTTFLPIRLPSLDGYTDITSSKDLLPQLIGTARAGNFDFNGVIDLEVLNLHLQGVMFQGGLDFSGETFRGYVCIDVPYLYGLTSDGVPLKYGNSLLCACSIKSELFFEGDRIYICRTIQAEYGYGQPMTLVHTKKRYLSIDDAIQNPDVMIAFVLNLNRDVNQDEQGIAPAKASSSPNFLIGFHRIDDNYMLKFDTDLFLPAADELTLFVSTNEEYISKVGVETVVSGLKMRFAFELFDHGNTLLDFAENDFSSYLPLQDQ